MLNYFFGKREEKNSLENLADQVFEATYPAFNLETDGEDLNEEESSMEDSFEALSDNEINDLDAESKMDVESVIAKYKAGK